VRDPDVALAVDEHAVRPSEEAGAELAEAPAVQVELEDDGQVRLADAGVGAATLGDPDRAAGGAGVDGARRAPCRAGGQLAPRFAGDDVGIVLGGDRPAGHGEQRGGGAEGEDGPAHAVSRVHPWPPAEGVPVRYTAFVGSDGWQSLAAGRPGQVWGRGASTGRARGRTRRQAWAGARAPPGPGPAARAGAESCSAVARARVSKRWVATRGPAGAGAGGGGRGVAVVAATEAAVRVPGCDFRTRVGRRDRI